jgi:hypothetical protein
VLLLGAVLCVLGPRSEAHPNDEPVAVDPLDRVQMHRNANRSVPYLPLARHGASPGASKLVMRPVKKIELDGDPLQNVYSSLLPIVVDDQDDDGGGGRFGFVQWNGFRFMQLWDRGGERRWRVENRSGRLHDLEKGTHRDTAAILDLDGDGRQDIAHCWMEDGQRKLIYRRGRDGKVIASAPLVGSALECHVAAFRMAKPERTILLVAERNRGADRGSCPHNFLGDWSRTLAYDLHGNKLWERNTCDAGHHVWPLDEDQDGRAEAVFVGKYLLRGDGSLQCELAGWPRKDHVDGLSIADLDPDPSRPGLEAVAVGQFGGTALFRAATCRQIWRIPTRIIRNPQHVAVAKLDARSRAPLIQVDERGVVPGARSFVLDGRGRILAARQNDVMAMQNANLDGVLGVDESVGSFGVVTDRFGQVRLSRAWYWNLRGRRVRETRSGPYPDNYNRWQAFPLVFDWDRDGRDEIVTWGQSLIVIGKVVDAD